MIVHRESGGGRRPVECLTGKVCGAWRHAARTPLNRTARVQRRVCELIRMRSVLPQGTEQNPGSVPKMIEIRVAMVS